MKIQGRCRVVARWTVAALALLAFPAGADADPLPRSAPERQGVSSAGVLGFVEAADAQIEGMHSFMLVRHGHVVAEGFWTPYDPDSRHLLYSLTKSFTSTAVGLAVAEGKLSVDDRVLDRLTGEGPPEASDQLKAMRVRDLLTMSTGHHDEAPFRTDPDWVRSFLAHPVVHKPGTFFLYNTPASNTLASIVHRAVGQDVIEYLRPRLFEPLGIADPVWSQSPQGVSIGGYGLSLRTEEIARFGQLYLQKGEWRGRRLVPAAWAEAATARQVSNGSNPRSDWEQGYGFQFWRCRHGAYRGDGAFGQFCVVLPEQQAVIAITSGVKSMQAVLDLVWERLLPVLHPAPLPEDPVGEQKLRSSLLRLTLALPPPKAVPAVSPKQTGRRYAFPPNDQKLEWAALERKGEAVALLVRVGGLDQRLDLGRGEWRRGRLTYGGQADQPVAAAGAWSAPETYAAKLAFYETPFALNLSLRFEGDTLYYDSEWNVAFGPTRLPPLVGTALVK